MPQGVRTEGFGMPTGTIARLLIDKGFGFIRDESGIEHFFHRSSVRGAVFELLREGQRVEFAAEQQSQTASAALSSGKQTLELEGPMTPSVLSQTVAPYVAALEELQHVIDD